MSENNYFLGYKIKNNVDLEILLQYDYSYQKYFYTKSWDNITRKPSRKKIYTIEIDIDTREIRAYKLINNMYGISSCIPINRCSHLIYDLVFEGIVDRARLKKEKQND